MNTNTYELAVALYAHYGETTLEADIALYRRIGYVIDEGDSLLIGRDEGGGWHVQLAVGDIRELIRTVPYPLPWIGWERINKPYKWHNTERLMKTIEKLIICRFGGGGSAKPPPPPKPPSPTDAASNLKGREDTNRRRNANGYASTILTSGLGIPDKAGGKSLLGQ